MQDLVIWGLIPRMILFCRVSDPAGELNPHRFRPKSFESLPFSLKGHFSLSRGVWYPVEQLLFSINSQELKPELKNVSGYELGAHFGSIHEKKTRGQKSRATVERNVSGRENKGGGIKRRVEKCE
jgi:hypothetical protein